MFLFLLLVAWGIGFLVWKGFKPQISDAVLSVRSAQMKIAELWYDDQDIIRVPMQEQVSKTKGFHAELGDIRTRWYDTNFGIWRDFANTAKPDQIQADHLKVVTYVALYPLRWVIVGIIACMFVWVIFTGPTSRFHRVMGLEAVIRDQAKTFKVIRPFIKFNPNHLTARPIGAPVPVDLPMFAEALSPEEWIAIHEIPYVDGVLDTAAAEAAFAKELGPRWKGAMALPAELQVILAAFCLKAARKRNESDELLGRLACCWDHKTGLRLSRERGLVRQARKILRDKKLSEKTLGNCNRHAYVSTAMMRALNTAREDGGVLAPAQFVWLRAHNRSLWYPLNNLGRQAFHMEAIAAAAHYRAEKHINRPIPRPRVMDALDGLLEHLKNPIFVRPIPEVDYGSAGRRKNKNALTKAA